MPHKDKEKRKQYQKEYHKNWYKENRVDRIKQIRDRRRSVRIWLKNHKLNLSCIKCGENHPATLDFHHKRDKIVEVSLAWLKGWSIERVKKEIEKCDVLCSNCHRKEHYLEVV